jgi:hypothetical protein
MKSVEPADAIWPHRTHCAKPGIATPPGVSRGSSCTGSDAAVGLNQVLDNRDAIGQPRAPCVKRFTLTDEQAFLMLVEA